MATTKRQDKIQATIERLKARKAKFESGAYNKKYEKMFGDDDRDHYRAVFVDDKYDYYEFTNEKCPRWQSWLDMDYCQLIRQIKDNEAKLGEAKRLDAAEDEKAAKKADKQATKTATLDNLPKSIAEFREKTIQLNKSYMLDKYRYYRKLGYTGAKKSGSLREYSYFTRFASEQKVIDEVIKNCDNMIINLLNRIKDKVGNITDASCLHTARANDNEGYAINGFVKGDKGECVVKSVSAGGYNIQCWHIRTIVK